MPEIRIDQYYDNFSGNRGIEALKYAHEIRKFEIDLYWKRAAYFWTFIGAAFAGYFWILKQPDTASIFVVTSLGFVFSLSWYCVNRGSGAWQRNWERHVDFLEDRVTGPLHKTLIDRGSYKFKNFAEPFPFSPSRINNILALYVTVIWGFLMVRTAWNARDYLYNFNIILPKISITIIGILVLTIVTTIILFTVGKSRREEELNESIPTRIFLTPIQQ